MARIDVLPSIEIIRGSKKILDFYVWRGLPCVRAWPKYRPARQTDASLAAALTFGAIVKAYSLLAHLALLAYREDALDQPRTARDIMVTGVFGNLHEASMSDFLDALIIIRDATIALTDLLHALHTDGSDRLDVDVHASVLPPLAATTTNQGLIYARLGLIDDLQDALESKALDRLLVRGMDQLFSLKSPLKLRKTEDNVAAGDHTLQLPAFSANTMAVVTSLMAYNSTSANTFIDFRYHDGANTHFVKNLTPTVANMGIDWQGFLVLHADYKLQAHFKGCLLNDDLRFYALGFYMTRET